MGSCCMEYKIRLDCAMVQDFIVLVDGKWFATRGSAYQRRSSHRRSAITRWDNCSWNEETHIASGTASDAKF